MFKVGDKVINVFGDGRTIVYVDDYELVVKADVGDKLFVYTKSGAEKFLKHQPKTWWVNVYPHSGGGMYDSKYEADKYAMTGRIACVKVTEGQFDD